MLPSCFPLFRRKLPVEYLHPLLGTTPPSNSVYFRNLARFPKVVQHDFELCIFAERVFPHDWMITPACRARRFEISLRPLQDSSVRVDLAAPAPALTTRQRLAARRARTLMTPVDALRSLRRQGKMNQGTRSEGSIECRLVLPRRENVVPRTIPKKVLPQISDKNSGG